jgi:hypothetical protein
MFKYKIYSQNKINIFIISTDINLLLTCLKRFKQGGHYCKYLLLEPVSLTLHLWYFSEKCTFCQYGIIFDILK